MMQDVRAKLVDPESAKFSELTWNPATRSFCGNVNAKGPAGGYVGRTGFVWTSASPVVFNPGPFAMSELIRAYTEVLRWGDSASGEYDAQVRRQREWCAYLIATSACAESNSSTRAKAESLCTEQEAAIMEMKLDHIESILPR
jgi:hypothetical protein